MSSEEQRFSRQDLLTAFEEGWKHYLRGYVSMRLTTTGIIAFQTGQLCGKRKP